RGRTEMLLRFQAKNLVHPPQEMAEFVEQLIRRLREEGLYYTGPDRRSEKRHSIALLVRAMPLDDDLRAAGPAFTATTRDLSHHGIALIHHERINCRFLAVELTDFDGKQLEAAVELLRCRAVGPYF